MPTPEPSKMALKEARSLRSRVGARQDTSWEWWDFTIASALDRFAAQRGAEPELTIRQGRPRNKLTIYEPPQTGGGDAPSDVYERDFGWVPEFLSDPPPPTELALKGAALLRTLRKERLATEGEDTTDQRPTTAQTGGGDAGERDFTRQAIWAYYGYDVDVNDIDSDSAEAATIERIDAALRSSHREAEEKYEAGVQKAYSVGKYAGSREGAEAMREADAQLCDRYARLFSGSTPRSEGMLDATEKLAAAIRANPIPGKTDAG